MREFVKLWERIFFAEDGEAVSWEKSFDDGKTWEAWPSMPPFIRMDNLDQIESVTIEYRVPKFTVETIRKIAKQLRGGAEGI